MRKGDLGWAHHPRGGLILGQVSAQSMLFGVLSRKICGMTVPSNQISPLSMVPEDQPVVMMDEPVKEHLMLDKILYNKSISEMRAAHAADNPEV